MARIRNRYVTPSARSFTFIHSGLFPFTSTVTILLTPVGTEAEPGLPQSPPSSSQCPQPPPWCPRRALTVHGHAGLVDQPVAVKDAVGQRWWLPGHVHRRGGQLAEPDGAGGAGGCGGAGWPGPAQCSQGTPPAPREPLHPNRAGAVIITISHHPGATPLCPHPHCSKDPARPPCPAGGTSLLLLVSPPETFFPLNSQPRPSSPCSPNPRTPWGEPRAGLCLRWQEQDGLG